MRSKVCVITSAGKRVCGRPISKASGAATAQRPRVPEVVGRQFDYLAEKMVDAERHPYRWEGIDSGHPMEKLTVRAGDHEVELAYYGYRGTYGVIESLYDGSQERMTGHATFADATRKFLALVEKYGR